MQRFRKRYSDNHGDRTNKDVTNDARQSIHLYLARASENESGGACAKVEVYFQNLRAVNSKQDLKHDGQYRQQHEDSTTTSTGTTTRHQNEHQQCNTNFAATTQPQRNSARCVQKETDARHRKHPTITKQDNDVTATQM